MDDAPPAGDEDRIATGAARADDDLPDPLHRRKPLEVVVVAAETSVAGLTVTDLEDRAKGAFFVVQITRQGGEVVSRPPGDMRVLPGDALLVVGRSGGRIKAIFSAPAERARAGRTIF